MKKSALYFSLLISLAFITGSFLYAQGALIDRSVSAAPAPPTDFKVSSVSACSIKLDWSQSGGFSRFEYKNGRNIPSFTRIESGDLSGSNPYNFLDEGLSPNTAHAYSLHTCPSFGDCSSDVPSMPNSITTPSLVSPPSPPTNMTVDSWSSSSGGQVTLKWTPSATPDYSGFRVYRSDNGSAFSPVTSVPSTFSSEFFSTADNKWSDSVSSDVTHSYKVKTYQTAQYCKGVGDSTSDTSDDWVKFSSFSSELVVPARPVSVSIVQSSIASAGTQVKADFQWDKSQYASALYDFQISTDPAFGTASTADSPGLNVTKKNYSFDPTVAIYYRVKACSDSATKDKCSDWTTGTYTPTLLGPAHISYFINFAAVNLYWQDEASYPHKTLIFKIASSDSGYPSYPTTPYYDFGGFSTGNTRTFYQDRDIDSNMASGDIIKYMVVFENSTGKRSPSVEVSVDTKAVPISNWGWSSVGQDLGIGWLRTNVNAVSSAWGTSSVVNFGKPFSVFVGRSGNITGDAWTNYGWLSFNQDDLGDCPSGTCAASVGDDGKVSGWAKFIAADPTVGAWNGWVSLRGVTKSSQTFDFPPESAGGILSLPVCGSSSSVNTNQFCKEQGYESGTDGTANYGGGICAAYNGSTWVVQASGSYISAVCKITPTEYGLCYGDALDSNGGTCTGNGSATNNKFSGFAWGGNVTGWIGFNNANVVNAPTITKINPSVNSVEVQWNNPKGYSQEDILRSDPEGDSDCKVDPKLDSCRYIKAKTVDKSKQLQGSQADTVDGLQSDTLYGFKVRGYTQ